MRILSLIAGAPPREAQINTLVFGGAGRSWSDVIQVGSLIDATSDPGVLLPLELQPT